MTGLHRHKHFTEQCIAADFFCSTVSSQAPTTHCPTVEEAAHPASRCAETANATTGDIAYSEQLESDGRRRRDAGLERPVRSRDVLLGRPDHDYLPQHSPHNHHVMPPLPPCLSHFIAPSAAGHVSCVYLGL